MKLAFPLLILSFFLPATLSCQTDNPVSGREYRIVYQLAADGPLRDAEKLTAVYVFNFWGKRTGTRLALVENIRRPDSSRVQRVALERDGRRWTGLIRIPGNAAVLSYYVTDGTRIDDNGSKTFVAPVYSDGRPVQNAHYFMITFLKMRGASIEEQIEEAQKEIKLYPQNFRAYYLSYQLRIDWRKGSPGIQSTIAAELEDLIKKYPDNIDLLNLAARTYYYLFKDTQTGLAFRNKIPPESQYPDVMRMYDREAFNQQKERSRKESSEAHNALLHKPAPLFALDFHPGGIGYLEHYRGKVILLVFWATWIKSCQEQLAAFERIYDDYRSKELEILAISIDPGRETVREFLKNHSYRFPILFADNETVKQYGVSGIPQTVLIDRLGNVRKITVGYAMEDEKEWRRVIEDLLRGS